MRFNIRLHGRTSTGIKCRADITVYASSEKQLKEQAHLAATNAAWYAIDPKDAEIPEGSEITVEHVSTLDRIKKKK